MNAHANTYLHLQNVAKRFDDFVAVDDFCLEVAQGEFVTLLGPSGSGKTTTLNMIAGFLDPTSGVIEIDGLPVTFTPPDKRNIGMVFQNYALFPHMNVLDNIAFPLRMRHVPGSESKNRVAQILELVQLAGYEMRRPAELSGGQRQRVALARAMVFNPRVLLMDEPLGSLDKKLRENMQLEILRIHKAVNITVIYVTHDQTEALTMSDRIVVMDHGKIQQIGTPQGVYEAPINRFVAEFIGETNLLSAQIIAGDERTCTVETAGGLQLRLPCIESRMKGDSIYLSLRPESVTLIDGTDEGPGSNVYRGVVREVIYLGDSIRYSIILEDRDSMTVKQMNRPGVMLHHPGEQVRVGLDLSALRVVSSDVIRAAPRP